MCKKLALSFLCSPVLTVHVEHHGSIQISLPTGGGTALDTDGTHTAPIFLTGMQVIMHKTHEQPSTPQANRFGTDITMQPHVKQHEPIVGIARDIEGKAE